MQYEAYNQICSTGTQTKLSSANKDDVLVSFTSTYSLLSSTFTQFLVEISQMLQLPLDKNSPLLPVERLLAEFKERSLENVPDKTQLSFHSPLIQKSPENVLTPQSEQHSPISSPSSSTSSPTSPPACILVSDTVMEDVSSPLTPASTPFSRVTPASTPSATTSSLATQCSSSDTRLSSRLPIIPVPSKITKELPDSTNSVSPSLPNMTYSERQRQSPPLSIRTSERSAFFKPAPKPTHMEPVQVEPDSSTQVKCEPISPRDKSDKELFECLQKLQNCYDKYLTPQKLPFSLSNLLSDVKPNIPNISMTPSLLHNITDPNLIIKAMQENNPLLKPLQKPEYQLFNNPMKCPYCELTFHKKSHLSNHLVQLHSCSYHCCRQCKISFPDRQSLELHQQSHPKQQFQCTGCNLSFKTGSELKRHIKTHTQERAFMCDICGSRFNLKHNLKAHMRQHTGERPFRCKICNRGFTRSNNLKRHLYAHCQEGTAPAPTRASPELLSMLPNMVMLDRSRFSSQSLSSLPLSELKVD